MRWRFWHPSKEKKLDLEKRGISLLERTFKSIPVVLIGIVLTLVLSRSGFFRQIETYSLDTQVRLQGVPEDSLVAVVLIDRGDFASLFQEKSPLDPGTLHRVIGAIAAGKPKVIGVAIDTSAPEFKGLQPAPDWPPIVWAQNGVFSARDNRYHLDKVLGGQPTAALSGLVALKLDEDGAIRRYPRLCETDQGLIASFPWAVAKEVAPAEAARREATQEGLFIKFAGDSEGSHRLHFTASRILGLADGPGWQNSSPVKDKIVLLGGAYDVADEHGTPLGWMLGVEVLAHAVETELGGGGLSPPNPILITAIGGLVGLLLLLLFQHFTPVKGFLMSALAIPVSGVICSLLIFKTTSFWAYFVPIPLAVLGQEFYAQVKAYRMRLIEGLYKKVMEKAEEATGTVDDAREGTGTANEMTDLTAKEAGPNPGG
jgi:CHASE2 domain-containing sensor protein